MYKTAYQQDEVIFYFDRTGNKYVARGGSLSWRINNPGLVHHHCHFARKNGTIGACHQYAIFSNPRQGRQALREWFKSKKYQRSNLSEIASHYHPKSPASFLEKLVTASAIPAEARLNSLSKSQLEHLLSSIELLCGGGTQKNGGFELLPKITAKIENQNADDNYIISTRAVLCLDEAIEWVATHRLDAVIAHKHDGSVYLRSRPRYQMRTVKLTTKQHCETTGQLDTFRAVGNEKHGQCIWGFVNGVCNTKAEALRSCKLISEKADSEQVLSLPNDTLLGLKEVTVCLLLKLNLDTPIVIHAAKFLRSLLNLSEQKSGTPPVVVFAHSQGAAIVEHALKHLLREERQKIRVFTFGGWSFIAPGEAHPDTHNYASVGNIIPRAGSLNLQYLAMQRHEGFKEGLTIEEVIRRLASQDSCMHLDSLNPKVIAEYEKARFKHYQRELERISNVSVINSSSHREHSFKSPSYQAVVKQIVAHYRNPRISCLPLLKKLKDSTTAVVV